MYSFKNVKDILSPFFLFLFFFFLLSLFHGTFVQLLNHVQFFFDPMDCNPPGSSDHVILQARILEWVAISFSRWSFWPRNQTHLLYPTTNYSTNYDSFKKKCIQVQFLLTTSILTHVKLIKPISCDYSQMCCLIFSLFPSWVYFQKYMECKAITLKSSQTMSFSVQSTAIGFPFFLSKANVLLKDSMRIFFHLPLWLDPPTTWGYFVFLLFIKYIIFWELLHLLPPLPGFYFCYYQACSILS